MFNSEQLKEFIIKPAITDLLMNSDDAIALLLFTCANESNGGTYIKQLKGPALGIYQMEPTTYNDIWVNFIMPNASLRLIMTHHFDSATLPDEYRLMYDLRFATAMTRIHYARVKLPLPKADDIDAIWDYYKTHYNSSNGKADYSTAIAAYRRFICPKF